MGEYPTEYDACRAYDDVVFDMYGDSKCHYTFEESLERMNDGMTPAKTSESKPDTHMIGGERVRKRPLKERILQIRRTKRHTPFNVINTSSFATRFARRSPGAF